MARTSLTLSTLLLALPLGLLGCEDKEEETTPEGQNAGEGSDGADNDGDGLVDFPDDPGCEDAVDMSERERACANGVDDDEDGATDFPADPGCASYEDDDEFNESTPPECADGIDNDRNGDIDEQEFAKLFGAEHGHTLEGEGSPEWSAAACASREE